MEIDVCTNYRFQGNLSEIVSVFNKAIKPFMTNSPDASDLHHIMSNQIQYCSGTSEFFFSISHNEEAIFELMITINKPSSITPILQKISSDNFEKISGNPYYQDLELENVAFYSTVV
jgi:hypothetical protein